MQLALIWVNYSECTDYSNQLQVQPMVNPELELPVVKLQKKVDQEMREMQEGYLMWILEVWKVSNLLMKLIFFFKS